MKKIGLITIFFLFAVLKTSAQKAVEFNDCQVDYFLVNAQSPPEWIDENVTLNEYLKNYFKDSVILKKTKGRVIIGILILEDGKTCCKDFIDMTGKNLNAELFRDAVNSMPRWSAAKQDEKPTNYLQHFIFYIDKGTFIEVGRG